MKLLDAILLALATGFLVIAIHQTMVYGWMQAYWIFMLSVTLLLAYKYRKDKKTAQQVKAKEKTKPNKKKR